MNSWGNEQFHIQNMMHGIHNMIPNMMPPGAMTPLVPPLGMIGEFHQMQMQPMLPHHVNHPHPSGQFVGPAIPETVSNEVAVESKSDDKDNEPGQTQDKRQSKDKSDRRDRERERGPHSSTVLDRGRHRSRSHTRDHSNKNKGNRGDRNHNKHPERFSKWKNNNKVVQQPDLMQPHNNMMPGQPNMMQFGNMMQNMQNPMINQQMDMSNLPTMMPNMIMMNQPIQMTNQHIYFSKGVILPALPGTPRPQRRERPPGCRTIFIGGLPKSLSIDHIKEIFQRFGEIDDVKVHKQGICQLRFEKSESVELSFSVSGSRIKCHDQMERDATTVFVDFAVNREDLNESDKNKRKRNTPSPPRVEQFNATTFTTIGEKIKSDNEFAEAAPTLAAWLERGECNKKNSNTFYALIQATNNQLRRLFNEKMQIDDENQALRASYKEKFGHIIMQFEQVAKILTAAKIQRVSDHFSKQQRRNIEMWLKMTEELDGIKDEFHAIFDDEEVEKGTSKPTVPLEKYEQLRIENANLTFELDGYKNEAHLAKDEAERKFKKFKAHFIAQQALQNNKQVYPPLPPPPIPNLAEDKSTTRQQLPQPAENAISSGTAVNPSEARLISLLSSFLMVHPLGASLDYLVSYVKSLAPDVTQSTVLEVLKKYNDVFHRKTTGVGARIENKWCFVIFDGLKTE